MSQLHGRPDAVIWAVASCDLPSLLLLGCCHVTTNHTSNGLNTVRAEVLGQRLEHITHPTTFPSSYETMIFAPTCPDQELSSCLNPHDLAKTNRREMATTSSKQAVRPGRLRAQRFFGSVDRHSRSLSRHQSYCLGSEVRE